MAWNIRTIARRIIGSVVRIEDIGCEGAAARRVPVKDESFVELLGVASRVFLDEVEVVVGVEDAVLVVHVVEDWVVCDALAVRSRSVWILAYLQRTPSAGL